MTSHFMAAPTLAEMGVVNDDKTQVLRQHKLGKADAASGQQIGVSDRPALTPEQEATLKAFNEEPVRFGHGFYL